MRVQLYAMRLGTVDLSLAGPGRQLASVRDAVAPCFGSSSERFVTTCATDVLAAPLSNASQVLQYWRSVLSDEGASNKAKSAGGAPRWSAKELQELLHTAVRIRHGRVSGVLPEQLLATFMQVYRSAMGSEDRKRLFLLICQDFSVQGMHSLA